MKTSGSKTEFADIQHRAAVLMKKISTQAGPELVGMETVELIRDLDVCLEEVERRYEEIVQSSVATEQGAGELLFPSEEIKRAHRATLELLRLINTFSSTQELIQFVTAYIKKLLMCDAIGIRLKDGYDYPYYETLGFPEKFLKAEMKLCSYKLNGELVYDNEGNPLLECMCGNILSGRFDPSKSYFTPHGSFWNNCISELLSSTTEDYRHARTRNRCNSAGYESVGLFPLRLGAETFGLLQVNNKRRGFFTPGMISFLEQFSDNFAISLAHTRAEEALLKSKALLEETQELGKIGGWEYSVVTGSVRWTNEMYRIYEVDADYDTNNLESNFSFYLDEDRLIIQRAFNATMENGEPFALDVQFVAARGTHKCVRVTGRLETVEGTKVRMYGAVLDITERKETEQRLLEIQRRESIGILSGGIAHDYNNLLGIMMGNASLAQAHLPAGHPALKNIEKSMSAMDRAAVLTKQMLAYAGKGKFQLQTIDIAEVIQEHVALLKVSLPKNVRLIMNIPPVPVYVDGDPGQIEQIVINLIINGSEAIEDGRGVVSISLSEATWRVEELAPFARFTAATLKEGDYALLQVNDTGGGMNRNTLAKIFDPFFTTKFTGRGLGLSAVLGIVQGHKGGISVDSTEGKGTTFSLVLPIVTPLLHAEQSTKEQPHEELMTVATILVIDDEADVAAMAKEILETEHYSVLAELNPVSGVEVYKQHRSRINAVLLDLTMPEMSGREVVDALQAIDPGVKIIITSGYTEKDVVQKLGVVKVSGFIQKPYRLKSLLNIVQSVL